jgi:PPOX class probable F420-dependent enzyme
VSEPAASGALSLAQVDELLRRPIVARLATVDPAGYPAIVPVWIEWDGSGVWLVARALAAYVADIVREPRVGLSVVAEDDPDRRVQILGHASIVEGPGPLEGRMLETARSLGRRYEGEAGLAYIEASHDWPRCLIRIDPRRIRSWSGPDWHDRYRQDTPAETGSTDR